MIQTAVFSLLALIIYTYIGYPIIIVLLSKIFKRSRNIDNQFSPSVSWVVPSYNEEDIIADKIRNLIELDYPRELLEIIVITDGSTDKTPIIAAEFPEVKVLHEDRRGGKSAAENRAMKFVSGDIVVFNDANTIVSRNALKEMVKHYADPIVGGVSGAKGIIVEDGDTAESKGEGLYWRYESAIKKADSAFNSLMGAAGELVSFRRALIVDLPEDTILDDFMQSFNMLKQGKIMVYEPEAKAEEVSSASVEEELKRKIRIAAGGWQSMSRLLFMLNVFVRPLQSWMYISHRALRWSLTAFALPILFLVNAFALQNGVAFQLLFAAQIVFYSVAVFAHINRHRVMSGAILAVYYFTIMNYAVIAGFRRFIKGSQKGAWERSKRKLA